MEVLRKVTKSWLSGELRCTPRSQNKINSFLGLILLQFPNYMFKFLILFETKKSVKVGCGNWLLKPNCYDIGGALAFVFEKNAVGLVV